jgi:hypothetical protein
MVDVESREGELDTMQKRLGEHRLPDCPLLVEFLPPLVFA